MSLVIDTPYRVRLPRGLDPLVLKLHLSYRDKRAEFDLKRLRNAPQWRVSQMGEDAYAAEVAELEGRVKQQVLFEDADGPWTHSGLAHYLAQAIPGLSVDDRISRPNSKLIPWAKTPDKTPRPYQRTAFDRLLAARHAAVEIGTGLGKSFIIMLLLKELGLKSLVMAPSVSIAGQLYDEFVTHFGEGRVGAFFDGKKRADKLITVGTAASLTKIEPTDRSWDLMRACQVFIADESHMCPADTLFRVCVPDPRSGAGGLAANAPYRFFFSGTQIRSDGLDLVLRGLTGDIVFRMTVREGVDNKKPDGTPDPYLAKPLFRMLTVRSNDDYSSKDVNRMTRRHLFQNPMVAKITGQWTARLVETNTQVLILVDEIGQIAPLLGHFRHEFGIAHGGVTKDNKNKLPERFHDSDPKKLVQQFNAGELPILIGTSCIGTGTDIRPRGRKAGFNLVGGVAETGLKQGVGRLTRLDEAKEFLFFDFDVENVDPLHRHADRRREIYADIYAAPKELRP